jgi:hypothetical protein
MVGSEGVVDAPDEFPRRRRDGSLTIA